MPDISMCASKECPKRAKCYRYRAKPSEFWQSYSYFYDGDDCRHFWGIEEDDRVREMEDIEGE